MHTTRSHQPKRRDLRAGFQLATSIVGNRSTARSIVRRCAGMRTADAFLLEVRRVAIEAAAVASQHGSNEHCSLIPAAQIRDPVLRAFFDRWVKLSDAKQRAAWNALRGRPFDSELLRTALDQLSDEPARRNDTPSAADGSKEPSLPTEDDIP